MVEIGQDEPDGPDVDMAVVVAAHQPVDRADIGAGAAADAAQRLGEHRVLGQGQAAVVQEDDVHFLSAVGAGLHSRGAGDPGDVGGDGLAGGVARQDLEDAQGRFEIRDQLVQAHQGHVHARQGRHQAAVALVGDKADGAGLGDGEIGAGDAHVGLEKCLAQLAPGHLDHAV